MSLSRELTVERLLSPTDDQVERLVELARMSYIHSPAVKAMTGGNHSLRPDLFRAMIRATALEGEGEIFTVTETRHGHDAIVGFGLWFGPGQKLFLTAKQRAEGLNDFWNALDPRTQEWWGPLEDLDKGVYPPVILNSVGQEAAFSSFYANLLASEDKFEERGFTILSALIDHVHNIADKAGSFLCLATDAERTTALYQGIDFDQRTHHFIPGPELEVDLSFPSFSLVRGSAPPASA